MNDSNHSALLLLPIGLTGIWLYDSYSSMGFAGRLFLLIIAGIASILLGLLAFNIYSPWAKENRKRLERVKEIPDELLLSSEQHGFLKNALKFSI